MTCLHHARRNSPAKGLGRNGDNFDWGGMVGGRHIGEEPMPSPPRKAPWPARIGFRGPSPPPLHLLSPLWITKHCGGKVNAPKGNLGPLTHLPPRRASPAPRHPGSRVGDAPAPPHRTRTCLPTTLRDAVRRPMTGRSTAR